MILTPNISFSKIYSEYFNYRSPAIVGIVILFFLPSDGLGIIVCWFQMLLDLPCPACGLTRGMSSFLHFEFYKSFIYHPLGVLVVVYLFIMAFSNKPDYLKSVIRKKSEKLAVLFSFKFITFLFLIFWIFKLLNIYFTH